MSGSIFAKMNISQNGQWVYPRARLIVLIIILTLFLFNSACSSKPGIDIIGMEKGPLKELLHSTPDSPLKVDILNELAYRECWNGGQTPVEYVNSATYLAKKIKYPNGLVEACCISGQIYFLKGNFDLTKDFSRKALGLAKAIHYDTGKAMAYNGIARYHQVRGEYDAALDNFLKSEEICKNKRDKMSKRILSGAYYGLGALNYYDPQDYREARKYFEMHLKLGREIGDNIIITSGYYTIGVMHHRLRKYADAKMYFNYCLNRSKKFGLKYNEANAYEGLGDMYVELINYEKALENYEKTHALFLQTGNIFQIAEIKKRLGKLFNKMGKGALQKDNHIKALEYLGKALKFAGDAIIPRTVADISEEIIKSYEALHDYQETSHYYKILLDQKEFLRKNEMSKQKLRFDLKKNDETQRIEKNFLIIGLIGLSVALVAMLGFSLKLRRQKVKIEDQAKRLTEVLKVEMGISNHKDDLMNTVYHQYKTPLANIDSSIQVLKEYSAKLSVQEIESQFNKIFSNLKKMAHLIDQLSMFGKKFNPADYDLGTICRDIIEEIKSSEGSKNTIEFDSSGYHGKVKVDKDILEIMLQNLVSNSIKFSPEGSNIGVQLIFDAGYVVIKVSDNGIGIPEDYMKLPFERFHRGSNVGAIPGTGLGLSIVKRYTDLHGGEISIYSQLNAGTTVTIKIPKSTN
ncbi:MAG: hypothetical protein QG657_3898 [Acidobacteriota bacterium]|nr:hypothetical protein [Acidobacteriota bacterium]